MELWLVGFLIVHFLSIEACGFSTGRAGRRVVPGEDSQRMVAPRALELFMIDVSTLPVDPSAAAAFSNSVRQAGSPLSGLFDSSGSSTTLALDVAQNVAIMAAGLGTLFFDFKPQGSCNADLVDIRCSSIPGANLGLYASRTIPAGTLIGTFPGIVKPLEVALRGKRSEDARDRCKRYMWAVDSNRVLDPTNDDGELALELKFWFGLKSVDTMVARINEPMPGGDCNVHTRVSGDGKLVKVFAERDIFADTELFMDYGSTFDRSRYADQQRQSADQARLAVERLRLEEDMGRVQPVVARKDYDGELDQDTSMNSGFLSKLRKKDDEARIKDMGIMSPNEGLDAFKSLGANMFGEKGDKELIESIKGGGSGSANVHVLGEQDGEALLRGAVSTSSAGALDDVTDFGTFLGMGVGGKSGKNEVLSPEDALNMFVTAGEQQGGGSGGVCTGRSSNTRLDNDLISSLRAQLGIVQTRAQVEDAAADDGDDFGTAGVGLFQRVNHRDDAITPSVPTPTGDPTPETVTALSPEEAASLQSKIDDMTDEQVEMVFTKMRRSLGKRVEEELGEKLAARMRETAASRRMSMDEIIDPVLRKKYDKELSMIENELEKMCVDPLKIFAELATNPEAFGGGEPTNDNKGKVMQFEV
jgi:hypothetical protein